MVSEGRNIIVIGSSAGGLEALNKLVRQLPTNLPASIFIVQHMAPENTGSALLQHLRRNSGFQCTLAKDGESFQAGRIYIAPPDHHLLVKQSTLLVTKGARENRYRPAIDPLFRSAAATHGPKVIGVVLTGMLDDGTAGIIAIKACGGVTVVQDPKDAAYPEMPQSALNNSRVDHCLPISKMGTLLKQLANGEPGKAIPIPQAILTEAIIAERVLSDVAQINTLGHQVPYNCPICGGVLWEMNDSDVQRYRCHTGHSFTAAALVDSQTEKIQETLWVSLRMFEERKNLLNNLSEKEKHAPKKVSLQQRANETQIHIKRIRDMLLSEKPNSETVANSARPSVQKRKK